MIKHIFRIAKIPIRHFSDDAHILNKFIKDNTPIYRDSSYHKSAHELREAIYLKNYTLAKHLVTVRNIPVDSHDRHENTALTDAAKRGDVQDTTFLIEELKANVYASCDCPYHKTAFHYASEHGNIEVLKILCKHGNKINILDKRGFTPLDVAKDDRTKKFLINETRMKGGTSLTESERKILLPK